MRGPAPLVFAPKNIAQFLKITPQRDLVIGPTLFVFNFGLEPPTALRLDRADFPFFTILRPVGPSVLVAHRAHSEGMPDFWQGD